MSFHFRTATCAIALVLSSLLIHADDPAAQPDRASLLPQLQKTGGKDWTVTTIPEGYLMTYQHPILYYPSNGATPTPDQLLKGKTTRLSIKIIFDKTATDDDLARNHNPFSERQGAPMSDALKAKLIQDHYAIVTPSSWANGPKYAVYIVSTTPPENSIYPSTASDAVDHVLSDLGSLFHFQ